MTIRIGATQKCSKCGRQYESILNNCTGCGKPNPLKKSGGNLPPPKQSPPSDIRIGATRNCSNAKCGRVYEKSFVSCPHCGVRNNDR